MTPAEARSRCPACNPIHGGVLSRGVDAADERTNGGKATGKARASKIRQMAGTRACGLCKGTAAVPVTVAQRWLEHTRGMAPERATAFPMGDRTKLRT